jgi:hypothetical protein
VIRVTRTFIAKPGVEHELINVLKDIQSYANTQDVKSRLFTEPWGPGGVVHQHSDFENSSDAQAWWEHLLSNPRAQESIARMEGFIEGHREASFLMETGQLSSSLVPASKMERLVRIVRSYDARPGMMTELVKIADDFRGFVASQGIPVAVFTEPFGTGGRLHYHTDYSDAGAALSGLENVMKRQRARDSLSRVGTLTEGHVKRMFLNELE